MEPTLLLDAHATIGESPTWVARENALYWIDVKAPSLNRLDLASRHNRTWRLSSDIGGFALLEPQPGPNPGSGSGARHRHALVALRHGLARLDLETGAETPLGAPPFDPTRHRFNEAACDSAGRLWLGTMFDPLPGTNAPQDPAGLFSFTLAGGLRPEPDADALHNGMAWSPDERTFYLAHSQGQEIIAFDYDLPAGRLTNRRVFAHIPGHHGTPDGAAIDAEGHYWCAMHGAAKLHRYRPDGTLDRQIGLPVSQPTMPAFIGPGLGRLAVTSAAQNLTPDQLQTQPHAGALLELPAPTRGHPRHHTVR